MPTYEYECLHCGHRFEIFQRMTDRPLEACPKCRKPVRRLIGSGSGIIFKGSGFYATDYRKGKKTETEKPSAPTCPKSRDGCNACQQVD
ncbi:MAG: hypothetical protein NC923_00540 [Candidatus Omnitrophica bacterium]|nr:hypothetical protein [Candidatus Omnitrophota bacterium]